jgi:HSP20 family protein
VNKDAISIEVEKNVLTIVANAEAPVSEDSDVYRMRERRSGKRSRTFNLPWELDLESSSCTLDSGILTITFKKDPKLGPRKLAIA